MKKSILYLVFIIILYLWLFYPPFWIFRERLAISNVICLICIFVCIIKPRIFKDFYHRFHKEFNFCTLFVVLSFILTFLDFQTRILTEHIIVIINLFVVVPVMLHYANRFGFGDESSIVRAILLVSCLGAFFSVLCIMDPNFNQYVKYELIRYDKDSYLYETEYRGFGIATGLVSAYGYVMGFIGALGCFYLKENRWYLFAIPFVFISVLLNARTGIVIMLSGMIMAVMRKGNFKSSIVLALCVILLAYNIESFLSMFNLSDGSLKWLMDFRSEAEDVASSSSILGSGTADTLLGDMWILPEDLPQWIIGRGYYLLRNEHGVKASDVGWINQLSYGGLMYVIPLIIYLLSIIRNLIKNKSLQFGIFCFLSFIIVNTKSSIFPSSVLFKLIMMLYFIYALNKSKISKVSS